MEAIAVIKGVRVEWHLLKLSPRRSYVTAPGRVDINNVPNNFHNLVQRITFNGLSLQSVTAPLDAVPANLKYLPSTP
jgi:hypothetical protein